MKRLLLAIALLGLTSQAAQVIHTIIAFTYNDPNAIIGFRAYYGYQSSNYTAAQDFSFVSATQTNYLIKLTLPGTNTVYLTLVAIGTDGLESRHSEEIIINNYVTTN